MDGGSSFSWRRETSMVGRRARSDPGYLLSVCPRLPPENPHLQLTTSDKRRSVSDRVCAAQRLFLTTNDKVGVATDGNKGSSVRIRPSRQTKSPDQRKCWSGL